MNYTLILFTASMVFTILSAILAIKRVEVWSYYFIIGLICLICS